MITVRPASRADFEAFYGKAPPMTCRARVAETSTGLAAIGGYYLADNVAVVFSDHTEAMTRKDRVRAGRALVEWIGALGVPVVANTAQHGPTAAAHFGFEPISEDVWILT